MAAGELGFQELPLGCGSLQPSGAEIFELIILRSHDFSHSSSVHRVGNCWVGSEKTETGFREQVASCVCLLPGNSNFSHPCPSCRVVNCWAVSENLRKSTKVPQFCTTKEEFSALFAPPDYLVIQRTPLGWMLAAPGGTNWGGGQSMQ